MSTVTPGQATAAWWAAQLYDRPPVHDDGRSEAEMTFAESYAAWEARTYRSPAPPETRPAFTAAVAEHVDGILGQGGRVAVLHCDYRPEGELAVIATAAGVPAELFPCKIVTFTYADRVVVRDTRSDELVWTRPGAEATGGEA